jgi:hypothetical protein
LDTSEFLPCIQFQISIPSPLPSETACDDGLDDEKTVRPIAPTMRLAQGPRTKSAATERTTMATVLPIAPTRIAPQR